MMDQEYDPERIAALINEARELAAQVKLEVEQIKAQVERVFDDAEHRADELDTETDTDASILAEVVPRRKSFWRRLR